LILFDASVLLNAYHTRSTSHQQCRRFLEEALSGAGPTALCWPSILAFLRIGTNPRVFEQPFARNEASAIVSAWLAQPAVVLLEPGDRFWTILQNLIETAQIAGPLMSDAALAALAIEHGAILATTDRDFTRFPSLPTVDPSA
jgi:toxin-antitoxin system PIN domain toxin